jgi:hypothetical protein
LDFYTLLRAVARGNLKPREVLEKEQPAAPTAPPFAPQAQSAALQVPATILSKMKPQSIGRVLGTGIRVAGRMAGERLAGAADAPAQSPASPSAQPVAQPAAAAPGYRATGRTVARAAGSKGGGIARGVGGFVRPFTRVGGILFLEVTGVVFLIFVLLFGLMVWRTRASYAAGPDHAKFLAAAVLTLIFLYLSVSSFWRAGRK